MANAKGVAIVLGLLLTFVGALLLLVTEPAGSPGSGASGGIADVSEDTRPYLYHGLLLILVGILVAAVAVVGMR